MPIKVTGTAATNKKITVFHKRIRERLGVYMQIAGEAGVSAQRDGHTYLDQTGNLTASVGYEVTDGGTVTAQGNATNSSEGNAAAAEALNRHRDNNPRHTSLTIVAGMQYARYVQARGYDVLLSGARAAVQKLKNLISKTR